jgi:hypothetical protein
LFVVDGGGEGGDGVAYRIQSRIELTVKGVMRKMTENGKYAFKESNSKRERNVDLDILYESSGNLTRPVVSLADRLLCVTCTKDDQILGQRASPDISLRKFGVGPQSPQSDRLI